MLSTFYQNDPETNFTIYEKYRRLWKA